MSKAGWWSWLAAGCGEYSKEETVVSITVAVVVVAVVFVVERSDGPCSLGECARLCLSIAPGEAEIAAIGAESLRRYADWPLE